MSTRSGKRLHNSSNENIEPELTSKKDKKTRNKRVVENGDSQEVLKPKKRQNYVSFPSEEEAVSLEPLDSAVEAKHVRALRWNTLRDHNAATEEVETIKKQVRSTKRTKKFSETAANEVTDVPRNEEAPQAEVVIIVNGKPKGKKIKKKSKKAARSEVTNKENDIDVVKKKKSKKKKNSKSNSLIDQEDTSGKKKNDSIVSTDSFHSAAGSPLRKDIAGPLNMSSPRSAGEAETLPAHNVSGNKKRRSSLKKTELNTSPKLMEVDEVDNTHVAEDPEITAVRESKRRSNLKTANDKESILPDLTDNVDLNTTFEKEPTSEGSNKKKRKLNKLVDNINVTVVKDTLDIPKTSNSILNTTFEKDDIENEAKSKKINNKSDDKEDEIPASKSLNISYEIRRSPRKSVVSENRALNGTFDMSPKPDVTKQKTLDSTFDKESKLDSTFDKTTPKQKSGSKLSIMSSDSATNSSIVTLDKSDEHSKISITDDDSKTENILNTTPLLIESSLEESKVLDISKSKTPEPKTVTPLKREGTFTKDSPVSSPKQTPNKRQTLPAAGCTPYHSNGKGSQKRTALNLTHSIEKPTRRSSLVEPRTTRVVFCSPVNNPGLATQRKSKIIKSNLKGSNKSFVFDESMSSSAPGRGGRKRSLTHAEGEPGGAAKRSRLAPEPRARTHSQPAKPSNPATPAKTPSKDTPSKPRSDIKVTKLPNFAALHARRFERMESLDECQERKAKRAKQLLVPTGSVAVLERSSPRVTLEVKAKDTPKPATPAKPASKLPTLDSLQRGYTRFGFKMHCDVNPFSVPSKIADKKPKETKPNVFKPNGIKPVTLKRQLTQPSLVGATSLRKGSASLRREVAKQTIMREKPFTLAEKRNETRKEVRTVIKGVRTNRRFELQMRSRNING